ncbi:Clp protease N-terminal domain-containing protein [Streptomyces griseoflavus]|uniref:Clp protease N-terminal domain-containing protein n=1 Tax=Streptomyces griseoflavus TaxID=35619 RepID=UPI003F4B0368
MVPYGPAAKKVLELTFREALRLGHNYIGTEHILLALLEHENGKGLLDGLGITKTATERYVTEMLAQYVETRTETGDDTQEG